MDPSEPSTLGHCLGYCSIAEMKQLMAKATCNWRTCFQFSDGESMTLMVGSVVAVRQAGMALEQ